MGMIQGLIYDISLGERHKKPTQEQMNNLFNWDNSNSDLIKLINNKRTEMLESYINGVSMDMYGRPKKPKRVFMTPEELSCYRHRVFCFVVSVLCVISWIVMIGLWLL